MSTIVRFNPARDFLVARDLMERMYEQQFGPSNGNGEANGQSERRLPVDVYSTDNEIVLRAGLPGVKPEAVEISIAGEPFKGEKTAKVTLVEFSDFQ